jgi:arsenate reductase-like glutaredoxin family protein
MEVQVFGTKKCTDTRRALRFFAERRIKTHFVDLNERAASLGELTRFAQKFGVGALIDSSAKRYAALGLATVRYSDERWLDRLVEEPMLLKTPLVRWQNKLTVGPAEETWTAWMAAA